MTSPRRTRSSANTTPHKSKTLSKLSTTSTQRLSKKKAPKPKSATKLHLLITTNSSELEISGNLKEEEALPPSSASEKENEKTIQVQATPLKPSQATPLKTSQSTSTSSDDDSKTTVAPNLKTPMAKYLQDVKQMFRRCSTPKKLVGRDHERSIIIEFITYNLSYPSQTNTGPKDHSGSLYISGMPGTGKSALLNEILANPDIFPQTGKKKPMHLFVNCMAHTSKTIFKNLVKELGLDSLSSYVVGEEIETLQQYVVKAGPPIVLILDEIDHLLTKDQDVLYSFFELASNPKSRMCLIGIANALDLTTRFLPRLKAKNFEPLHLSFAPYKVDEISAIIKDRLRGLEAGTPLTPAVPSTPGVVSTPSKSLMQPMAIELTARKLAGTGDLRKALDVCRHAIALVEDETDPQVTVKHILKVTSSLLGTSTKSRIQTLLSLPRLILTVLGLLFSSTSLKMKEISYADLYIRYRGVVALQKKAISCASSSEFQDGVGQLEVCGLVQYSTRKGVKMLSLTATAEEILDAVKGTPFIDGVIEKGIV